MTSGLEELNDLSGWLGYLNARVLHPAGSTFVYSGDPNIFGLALERRLAGEAVVDYFNRKLFQPLGMASIQWGTNFADGHPQLSGGAYVTARDWAKFGEFLRRTMDGSWTARHCSRARSSTRCSPATRRIRPTGSTGGSRSPSRPILPRSLTPTTRGSTHARSSPSSTIRGYPVIW